MSSWRSQALHRNRWVRILGVSFVMYVLSYIDRTNIAMAIPFLRDELGISASAIGFATGMFFWGYIILQIPVGRIAAVWSAKWAILGLLVLWSIVSLSTAFVRTETELVVNRFVLGIFEGGVLTSMIVLIRKWFARAERARANTLFLISIPIASVIANPHFRSHPRLLGLAHDVRRRSPAWTRLGSGLDMGHLRKPRLGEMARCRREKARILRSLEAERSETQAADGHWIKTIWHPFVILLALYNFAALMAEWGVNFWLPTVLKETGLSILTVGFLSALPYALPTEALPPTVAGVGIGIVNGAGNLGGTVGPYFFGFVRELTGSFNLALAVGGLSLILASLIAAPIRQRKREPG
jgi:MFS family permease